MALLYLILSFSFVYWLISKLFFLAILIIKVSPTIIYFENIIFVNERSRNTANDLIGPTNWTLPLKGETAGKEVAGVRVSLLAVRVPGVTAERTLWTEVDRPSLLPDKRILLSALPLIQNVQKLLNNFKNVLI